MGRKIGMGEEHLSHIYDKLGVPNRTAAALFRDRSFVRRNKATALGCATC